MLMQLSINCRIGLPVCGICHVPAQLDVIGYNFASWIMLMSQNSWRIVVQVFFFLCKSCRFLIFYCISLLMGEPLYWQIIEYDVTYVRSPVRLLTNYQRPYRRRSRCWVTDYLWPGIHGDSPRVQGQGNHVTRLTRRHELHSVVDKSPLTHTRTHTNVKISITPRTTQFSNQRRTRPNNRGHFPRNRKLWCLLSKQPKQRRNYSDSNAEMFVVVLLSLFSGLMQIIRFSWKKSRFVRRCPVSTDTIFSEGLYFVFVRKVK